MNKAKIIKKIDEELEYFGRKGNQLISNFTLLDLLDELKKFIKEEVED